VIVPVNFKTRKTIKRTVPKLIPPSFISFIMII
jgi:hypothetical protein